MLQSRLFAIAHVVLAASGVLSLATMVGMLMYALPNGDDFCRNQLLPMVSTVAGWDVAPDRIAYVADSWRYWTGRWLAMLVETTVLGGINLTSSYPTALLLLWSGVVGGLYATCRTLLSQPSRDHGVALGCTAALGALFWSGLPAPEDGFFWFTGGVENILPVALSGAIVALLCSEAPSGRSPRTPAMVAAAVGSFVIPGLHELHGLALAMVLMLGTIVTARVERAKALPWACCMVLALAGSILVILAPGNEVRGTFQPTPSFALSAELTAAALLKYLPGWVFSVPLLAATLAFIAHPRVRRIQAPWTEQYLRGWLLLLIPGLTIGLIIASVWGPSYALSRAVPPRTMNGAYLIFLIGWFITTFVATRGSRGFDSVPTLASGMTSAALVILAGSLTFVGSTRLGLSDLRHTAGDWHASMNARYELLRQAGSSTGTVAVPPAAHTPSLFINRDILADASNWRNRCLAGHFGVEAIVLTRKPVAADTQ